MLWTYWRAFYALLLKVRYIIKEIERKVERALQIFVYTPCLDLGLDIGFGKASKVSKVLENEFWFLYLSEYEKTQNGSRCKVRGIV